MSDKNEYLITYSPLKALIIFSLPMMAGNLFQQFYTMADSVIVGRFVGENALAAIGASYALTSVFISIAVGGGVGASVLTSKAFGSRDYNVMKESIWTNLISFLFLSVLLSIFGYFFSEDILFALNTPLNIMKDAELYLQIYFLGLPFLFMYNILSSVFNSMGASRIPLVLLIFSSILNIVLDLVSVVIWNMGIRGAALATLFSQALSAIISFCILLFKLKKIKTDKAGYFSSSLLKESSRIALPSILQQSTITIGMMLVQSVVNAFGSLTLAGYSAAIRIDNIVTVPYGAMMNSMSSYSAQNLGAKKNDRIAKGYRSALLIVIAFSLIFLFVLNTFSHEIISLFLGSEGSFEAYHIGEGYLRFLSFFYFILGFAMCTGGLLRGLGRMKVFTVSSMLNLLFRVVSSFVFAPIFGAEVVYYVVPIGWLIYFSLCYLDYRKAKMGMLYA